MRYDLSSGKFVSELTNQWVQPPNQDPADFLGIAFPPFESSSSKERLAAVFACVKVISETISTLPLHLYQKTENERQEASNHYLCDFLKDAPNEAMTWQELREATASQMVLRGNAYTRNFWKAGQLREIFPLPLETVSPEITSSRRILFKVQAEAHQLGKGTFTRPDVAHFKGVTSDGLMGISPLTQCRYSLNNAVALSQHSESLFRNGARPAGVLTMPGTFRDKDTRERVRKSWQDNYGGAANYGKTALLENGLEYKQMALSMADAQFIEQMKFSVEEITRIFRVPPHKIQSLDKATFSNIEHQALEFLSDTILPWVVRIEHTLNRNLLTEVERRQGYFFKHNVDALLRASYKDRMEGHAKAVTSFMSVNEVRKLEDLPPVDGGDVVMVPLNHRPLDQPEPIHSHDS